MSKQNNKQNNVMEMVPEMQPQTMSVKEVLAQDAIMIQGLNFTMAEAEKFMPIFAKIKNDLIACVEAIDREEKKHQGGEEHAEADPE